MAYVEPQQMRNWVLKVLEKYTTTDEGGGTEGTVTSVVAGDGMDFTTITDAGSIILGTPNSLDGDSTNAITATSHTHSISLTKADIGLSNVPNTDIAYSEVIPADDFIQGEVDNLRAAKLDDGTTPWTAFSDWDKSAGIIITESQISDLQSYLLVETDPVFLAWDKSTGIVITESQISDLNDYLLIAGGTLTLGEGLEFTEDYSINSLAGHTPNDSRIINLYDNSPPTDGALLITYDTTTSGDYAGEILYIDKDNFEWFGETVATQDWVENNATLYTHPNHTGQVTSIGDGATILTVSAISSQSNLPTSLVDTDEFIINSDGVLYKTNMAVLSNYVAVETVSFGTEGQIPYMNSINDDFDYSSGLVFDETDLTVSGGIKLLTGATVDTIETTLTDDNTHLPTSGAVYDAIVAIDTFIEHTDTPANYTGSGGFMVMVDSTPDALEFVDPSGYNLSNFNDDLGHNEMEWPGAGIALSTGSAWGTPITNNSGHWNTAYGWGNWATGVDKTFIDALNVDADTLDSHDTAYFAVSGHTHTFASLTSKPTTFAGYGISDTLANLNTALSDVTLYKWEADQGAINIHGNNIVYGSTASTACVGNDARLSDARTPTAHGLVSASHTVSGLTTGHFLKALSATTFGFVAHGLSYGDVGAEQAFSKNTAFNKNFGTGSTEVCVGNDSRLHASGSDDQVASDFAHNSLSGLNDGDSYEHITQAQKTALHARYADAEAVSAVATADDYLKNDGDTASGTYNFDSNTLVVNHSTHRVGIGTTSPGKKLTVTVPDNDTILDILALEDSGNAGTDRGGAIVFNLPIAAEAALGARIAAAREGAATPSYLALSTHNGTSVSERVRISSTGNVGIGTNNPASRLSILSGKADGAGVSEDGIKFQYNNNFSRAGIYSDGSSGYKGILKFAVNAGADSHTLTDAMTILGNGNVGIGTTSPQVNFEVLKSGGVIPTLGTHGGHTLLSDNGTWGMYSGIVNANGNGWIQQMRGDSTATAYNLLLQPVGGRVGIGTTSPGAKLHISDSTVNQFYIERTGALSGKYRLGIAGVTNRFYITDVAQSKDRLVIYDNGDIGINRTDPSYKLDVNGTGRFVNDVTASDFVLSSDSRLKKNIVTIRDGLNIALSLRPVHFNWKDDRDEFDHVGFIAQDMEKIRPEMVSQGGEYKGVGYSTITAINNAAIHVLNDKIIRLEKRIKQLEGA